MIQSWENFVGNCRDSECGIDLRTVADLLDHADVTGHQVRGQTRITYYTAGSDDERWRLLVGAPAQDVSRSDGR